MWHLEFVGYYVRIKGLLSLVMQYCGGLHKKGCSPHISLDFNMFNLPLELLMLVTRIVAVVEGWEESFKAPFPIKNNNL